MQEAEKEVEKKEVKVEKSGGGGEELQEVEKKWAGGLKRKTLPKAQAAESEEGAFGAEETAVGAEAEEAVGAEAAEAVGAEAAADEQFAMDAAEAKRRRKETMEMEELEHQVQTERAQWKEVLALLQRSHHDKQLKHQQQLIAHSASASATAATSSTDAAAAAAEATEATEAVEDNVDDGASGQTEVDDGASGDMVVMVVSHLILLIEKLMVSLEIQKYMSLEFVCICLQNGEWVFLVYENTVCGVGFTLCS